MEERELKCNLIDVNMGYGHQRTAYPLKNLAVDGKILSANNYLGIPEKDFKIWNSSQKFYEFISRFQSISFIGGIAFSIFDFFQKILKFYPKRNLSKPNFAILRLYRLFKKGWGKDFIKKFKVNLPIVSTFFTPAFMAEFFHYPADIFCIICDADISRTWAPLYPQKSKIKYFAPTDRVIERLKLYGVKKENIFFTGYPLPMENINTAKEDLKNRMLNLDPHKKYFEKYKILVETNLGKLPQISNHILTIMFAVGGAGAQKEIGGEILKSLLLKIKSGEIKVIISAGAREEVREYFHGSGAEIIFGKDINDYFQKFNEALRKTDILWTKPSELSFYTALGLPIIIAPTIGSQEEFNRDWLVQLGSAKMQENPFYVNEWFFDDLKAGRFAEMAMQGFIEGERMGTYNIKKIISQCSGF